MAKQTEQSPAANERESDAKFLTKLQQLAEDWRYSSEFIGQIVRGRWPRIWPGDES